MRIAIFGTVGAGKTTLIEHLKRTLPEDYLVVKEPLVDNPYFEKSYSPDPKIAGENAYKMEILMLAARMKQLQESKSVENVLYDRSIFDCPVFANCNYTMGNLNSTDWKVYREYFEKVVLKSFQNKAIPPYDYVIYLKVSDETSLKRIQQRSIERELNVKPEFWFELNHLYDDWAQKIASVTPLLIIDGNTDNPQVCAEKIIKKLSK
ncbi:deoxyadenosine/deoxycytidine kinase [Entomoplasma freundtii]|uniref:Deoxynucleoside kinase n=1 Tax=Entomoplasma freundtii TaxID=74700 RepID=A0A2K8NUM0_9MOLU|nr:deoxynucleoside kinase [Entomoplasma freundtii]ATZ16461.1 deoxynucleoside kinase [Entomoplasma freundtii]TDY55990.1 deoxyadenosine/deoxycytidine kinase [Entomoplasma freundtii]